MLQSDLPWKPRALKAMGVLRPKREPVQLTLASWRNRAEPAPTLQLELLLCLTSQDAPAVGKAFVRKPEPKRIPAKMRAAVIRHTRRAS